MKTIYRCLRSSFLLKALFTILIISLFFTEHLNAQDPNPLSDKLHEIFDKQKAIRLKLVSIASKGSGIPGWDRFANAVDHLSETISDIEIKIDNLTDRMSTLRLPFPNNLTIPGKTVYILGRAVHFPALNIPVPSGNRNFPRVSEFFANFLEPGDRALDKLLELATEIDDEMGTIPEFYPEGYDTTGWLDADYTWPGTLDRWMNNPKKLLKIKLIIQIVATVGEILKDVFDQELVVAAGGNLAIAKGIVDGIVGALNILVGIGDEINGDVGSAQVTASYKRLGFIHEQIDSVYSRQLYFDIEQNLAGHGDHPHPLAIFQLPPPYGYLDIARDIVGTRLDDMQGVGEETYNALGHYQRGQNLFLAGNYKKAYYHFSKAYGELTKVVIN